MHVELFWHSETLHGSDEDACVSAMASNEFRRMKNPVQKGRCQMRDKLTFVAVGAFQAIGADACSKVKSLDSLLRNGIDEVKTYIEMSPRCSCKPSCWSMAVKEHTRRYLRNQSEIIAMNLKVGASSKLRTATFLTEETVESSSALAFGVGRVRLNASRSVLTGLRLA